RPWVPGEDVMLLFTDGVSDARNRYDQRLGESSITDVVRAHRHELPAAILERALVRLQQHMGDVMRRDDLTIVVAKS
ncbi:MAG TPA: SpoIIE family protein phosphatase, partial [Gemmatimonadaceae bacterium]|nr:SpoIIE family protein phosphatase [Gemmatimonadaceae bacterium]